MPNQMESSFDAIELVSRPSLAGADQHNAGVCPALNTPSTEGKIGTRWYETPADAPNLIGKNVAERMDQSFQGTLVDNTFNKAGDAYANKPNSVDSSFEAENLVKSLGSGSTQGSAPNLAKPSSNPVPQGVGMGSGNKNY